MNEGAKRRFLDVIAKHDAEMTRSSEAVRQAAAAAEQLRHGELL
jgi:hypothetical protein